LPDLSHPLLPLILPTIALRCCFSLRTCSSFFSPLPGFPPPPFRPCNGYIPLPFSFLFPFRSMGPPHLLEHLRTTATFMTMNSKFIFLFIPPPPPPTFLTGFILRACPVPHRFKTPVGGTSYVEGLYFPSLSSVA